MQLASGDRSGNDSYLVKANSKIPLACSASPREDQREVEGK